MHVQSLFGNENCLFNLVTKTTEWEEILPKILREIDLEWCIHFMQIITKKSMFIARYEAENIKFIGMKKSDVKESISCIFVVF